VNDVKKQWKTKTVEGFAVKRRAEQRIHMTKMARAQKAAKNRYTQGKKSRKLQKIESKNSKS
jgi:hypothetical protein